jgi:hypothetical protein
MVMESQGLIVSRNASVEYEAGPALAAAAPEAAATPTPARMPAVAAVANTTFAALVRVVRFMMSLLGMRVE